MQTSKPTADSTDSAIVVMTTGISDVQVLVLERGQIKRAFIDGAIRAWHEAIMTGLIPFEINTSIDGDALHEVKLTDPLQLWQQTQVSPDQPAQPQAPKSPARQSIFGMLCQWFGQVKQQPIESEPEAKPTKANIEFALSERGSIQLILPKLQQLVHVLKERYQQRRWVHLYTERTAQGFEREPIANHFILTHWLLQNPLPEQDTLDAMVYLQDRDDIKQHATQQRVVRRIAEALNRNLSPTSITDPRNSIDLNTATLPDLILADTGGIPELKPLLMAQTALIPTQRWQWVRQRHYSTPNQPSQNQSIHNPISYDAMLRPLDQHTSVLDELIARRHLLNLLQQGAFVELLGVLSTLQIDDQAKVPHWSTPLQQWGEYFRDFGQVHSRIDPTFTLHHLANLPFRSVASAMRLEAALQAQDYLHAVYEIVSLRDKLLLDYYNLEQFGSQHQHYLAQLPYDYQNISTKDALIARHMPLKRLQHLLIQRDQHGYSLIQYRNHSMHASTQAEFNTHIRELGEWLELWQGKAAEFGGHALGSPILRQALRGLGIGQLEQDYQNAMLFLQQHLQQL